MKRILLDQGLAPRAARLLREAGWEAVHVSEAGLAQAEDAEVLRFACEREMTCVTLDHDFHAHLASSLPNGPSVVLVRVEGLAAERQVELIEAVWAACGEAISAGAAVSTDGHRVRFRKLPLR